MKRWLVLGLAIGGLMFLAACDGSEEPRTEKQAPAKPGQTVETATKPIRVEVVRKAGGWQLLRDGKPYAIRGAGIDRPKGVDPEGADLAQFAAHGGNSFRNWRDQSETDGLAILDDAQKHGMTVAMSIPVGRERKDFDYDDEQAVAKQMAYARSEVLRYRDHPALLVWVIGNEINLHTTNFKIFDAVNDIAKMIHELDPNHPVTTTWAGYGPDVPSVLNTRMPDLDFISVQLYADVVNLPEKLEQTKLDWPVMVTEWGTKGHWEVDKTDWDAPIEMNSSEKALHYEKVWREVIAAIPKQIIGSYAFVWGQKQERTPTWYGLFLEDSSETESIDALHHIWRGEWPSNRAPGIETMTLNGETADDSVILEPGGRYPAQLIVNDPDEDPLSFRWGIMYESQATQVGGDKEDIPDTIPGRIQGATGPAVTIHAPEEQGAYRLYVYVYDGQGNAGHANIPFLVGAP